MKLLILEDGAPREYSRSQLRHDNPNVSFPLAPTDDLLSEFGVYKYTNREPPQGHDPITEFVDDGAFEQSPDGSWSRAQVVIRKEPEEAAASVRGERDRLLSEENNYLFTKIAMGTEVPAEIASYMQSLRDVPQQPGFPYDVIWPERPQTS